MNEAYLKGRLVKAIRAAMPGAVVFRHEDTFTGGIPDISVTWAGVTSWIEVKWSPVGRNAKATPLQVQTLKALAAAGAVALVVNYKETLASGKVILVSWSDRNYPGTVAGWNHAELADVVHDTHVLRKRRKGDA